MPQAPSKRERKKSSAADKAVDVVDEGSEATIENKAVNGDDASGSVAVKEVPTSGLSKRKRKAAESWSKKSKVAEKAVDASEETAVAGQAEINPLTGEPAKKKRKPAEKAKDGEAKEAPPVATKAKRYTLFLGNLSFKTGKEEIEKHINDLTGGDSKPTAVRLQHDARTQKFKGFAFLDFANHAALEKVLQAVHHTTLQGRKVNVELTAGGGGTGEARRNKIAKKNEKLGIERENTQKTRRDQEAAKRKTRGGKDVGKSEPKDFGDINPARMARM